jgi:hypothetical protein
MPKPVTAGPKPSRAETWAAFLPWIIVCVNELKAKCLMHA